MVLTVKGKKVLKSMKKQYGSEKGEQVFYASKNKGKIKKVEKKKWQK
jgi:threonyl-tRNA synthetase